MIICILLAALALGTSPAENRTAIQKEVDAVSAKGGGRVEIPAGVWPTGSIELKSGVELHLAKGAVLKGSADRADYNADDVFPENFHSVGEEWSGGHLVYAYRAHDIAITGEGTIDGNGGAFFPEECQWNWVGNAYKYGIKLFPTDREWFRPGPMIAVFLSRNVRIEGVTLANTPCWTCHVRCSDGFTAKGVTIDADRTIANSDGFSIDCTRNVKIEKCTIKTGDDSIAVRASCRHHAVTNFCENVEIRDCDIWSCCYGVRLGIGTGTITNVVIADSRIHEAVWGVGYTPAWVTGARNVHILDTTVTNTTIRECIHPVHMNIPRGDTLVKGGRFVDCAFESVFPSAVGGNELGRVEDFRFERCSRKTIEHLKVRGDWAFEQRYRRDIRRESKDFAFVSPDAKNVVITNCSPSAETVRGVLILSFDDRNFDGWMNAIPLFDRYGAHATFFVSGEIGNETVRKLKQLRAHGHSVGLHGLNHADADAAIAEKGAERYYADDVAKQKRTCDVSYVPVSSFAYPNCRRTEEADALFFSKGFERVRGGVKGAAPYDPKGLRQKDRKPLVTNEAVYFPAADLPKRRLINTVIMGEAYHTDIKEICECLRRVAKNREVISITSHDIGPDAKGINMKTEWLETMLKLAKELDLQVLGFDELPPPED